MALGAASGLGQVRRSVDHARRPVDCLRGVGAADRCGLVLGGRLQAEQAAEGGLQSLASGSRGRELRDCRAVGVGLAGAAG